MKDELNENLEISNLNEDLSCRPKSCKATFFSNQLLTIGNKFHVKEVKEEQRVLETEIDRKSKIDYNLIMDNYKKSTINDLELDEEDIIIPKSLKNANNSNNDYYYNTDNNTDQEAKKGLGGQYESNNEKENKQSDVIYKNYLDKKQQLTINEKNNLNYCRTEINREQPYLLTNIEDNGFKHLIDRFNKAVNAKPNFQILKTTIPSNNKKITEKKATNSVLFKPNIILKDEENYRKRKEENLEIEKLYQICDRDNIICYRCKNLIGESFCKECNSIFCSNCRLTAHMKRENSKHTIIKIEDLLKNSNISKEDLISNNLLSKTTLNKHNNDKNIDNNKQTVLSEINNYYHNHKKAIINDNIHLKEKLDNINKNFNDFLCNVQYDLKTIQQDGLYDLKKIEDILETRILQNNKEYSKVQTEMLNKINKLEDEKSDLKKTNQELLMLLEQCRDSMKLKDNEIEREKFNKKGEISRLNKVYEKKIDNLIDQYEKEKKAIRSDNEDLKNNLTGEIQYLKIKLEEYKKQIDDLREIGNTYIPIKEYTSLKEEIHNWKIQNYECK